MEQEIERKFFVKTMPDLSALSGIRDERYYLYVSDKIEIRIQKRGEKYELERMAEYARLSRTQEKIAISKQEFEALKQFSRGPIIRDSYLLQRHPQITIKIYHGRFEGLVRAEVEFKSSEEAQTFQPLDWFGREMTEMPIAKDAKLIDLKEEELHELIR